MQTKNCPECGFEIIGRSDKVFCTDQCRNNYNNRLNRDGSNYVRKINNILRKNRRILSELNPEGTSKVHIDELASLGFRFDFHTNLKTIAGKIYHFCYEQGYTVVDNEFYLLIKIDKE